MLFVDILDVLIDFVLRGLFQTTVGALKVQNSLVPLRVDEQFGFGGKLLRAESTSEWHLLRIVRILVPLEGSVCRVGVTARVADERYLFGDLVVRIMIPLPMPFDSLSGGKHRVTSGKLARNGDLLVRVLLDVMGFDVPVRDEALTAELAQEWLQAFVNPQVGFQAMFVEEFRRTFWTIDELHRCLLVRVYRMDSGPSFRPRSTSTVPGTGFLLI